ncbi:MAG: DUF512 domain-containing protein [Candidatus Marinimicrobia bacterium]|nr:DUF512 domain-containing protein [Candidatus Neomarinimicrobiota bacterium]
MSLKIKSVVPDGLGAHLGLKPGDRLLKIDGSRVLDHLDYQFRIGLADLVLELEIDGRRESVQLDKEAEEDLGVEFEDFTVRSCANDCVFCFVDQNPRGLRSTLYFRDGDYRLSFLYGHYITMTNMNDGDLRRIVEQRLSPLNISIHATGPELRRRLLLYGKDDRLLDKMRYLLDNGILLHGQVVLCPGLNDGSHLRRTLDDLAPLSPGLLSVSIVPVGLTGHREGLTAIAPVTPEYAHDWLDEYAGLDGLYRHPDGSRMVFLSDEWYILAGREVPDAAYYGDLGMEENGVGQVRAILDQFAAEQDSLPTRLDRPTRFTIATGVLAAGLFSEHIIPRLNRIGNLDVNLEVVPNLLLGESVTVAGLLSGRDLLGHLKGKDLGEAVWTTDRILNAEEGIMLDDMTPGDISRQLGVPLKTAGDSLLELFGGADG